VKARVGRRAVSCGALFLVISCGAGAPGAARDLRRTVYVGVVEGTDAKIALASDGSRWAAYVCGGRETLSSMTAWFQGERGSANDSDVTTTAGNMQFDATFTDEEATGRVTLDGTSARFNATRVAQGGAVGLFQDDSNGCRSGLIVPQAGGGDPQGAYCADFTAEEDPRLRIFEQVTPVEPLQLHDGFLMARPASADLVLRFRPVLLPLD
jgi:hypothetical protein